MTTAVLLSCNTPFIIYHILLIEQSNTVRSFSNEKSNHDEKIRAKQNKHPLYAFILIVVV